MESTNNTFLMSQFILNKHVRDVGLKCCNRLAGPSDSRIKQYNGTIGQYLNGFVQEGLQWLFRVKFLFLQKCQNFCMVIVLFNLVEKHSPASFLGLNALVQLCCVHCTRFNILSSFFSEAKCKPAKKYRGNVLLLHRKSHAKIQVLLKENKFYPKKV